MIIAALPGRPHRAEGGTPRPRRASEVGDVTDRPVAGRHATPPGRRPRRLRGRDAISARNRGTARVDVAGAHPTGTAGRPWRPSRPRLAPIDAAQLAAAPMLGVAYGYCGAPDQWWQQQVVPGLQRGGADDAHIADLMGSYFELTELHIHPRAQGRGLGEALARRLLAGRARRTSCCRPRRSTASPTARGGSTAGSGSPTSSAATTSPAIPGRSRSSAAAAPMSTL